MSYDGFGFKHGKWNYGADLNATNDKDDKDKTNEDFDNNKNDNHYRYKQLEDSIKEKAKDKLREELRIEDSIKREKKLKEIIKTSASANTKKSRDVADEILGSGHMVSPVLMMSAI